jgi:hypothetical protein
MPTELDWLAAVLMGEALIARDRAKLSQGLVRRPALFANRLSAIEALTAAGCANGLPDRTGLKALWGCSGQVPAL